MKLLNGFSKSFLWFDNLDCWSRNLCDQVSFILSRFKELAGFSKVDSLKDVTMARLSAEPVTLPLINIAPLRIALRTLRRIFAMFRIFILILKVFYTSMILHLHNNFFTFYFTWITNNIVRTDEDSDNLALFSLMPLLFLTTRPLLWLAGTRSLYRWGSWYRPWDETSTCF